MEFSGKGRRNTIFFALLTLMVIGFTLVSSTWQILRQQEAVSLQHMAMGARSIAQAVESSYRRHGHMMLNQQSEFWPRLEELFTDVESGGDIYFIEILDERGVRLIASREKSSKSPYTLTPDEVDAVRSKGEWFGVVRSQETAMFVYAYKANPPARRGKQLINNDRFAMIVVGMNIDRHENMYLRFRQNAFLQSLYILAAAIFVWALALSLISRRSLIDKARYLERFQAELLDNMPDGLITIGEDGFVQSANPMAHELLSYAQGGLAGKRLEDLPGILSGIGVESKLQGSSEDGMLGWEQAEMDGKQLEILTSRFQGEHDQPITMMLIRNRTRVHNLERSLADAEKMAAVGTLAAGVAHEIRNPLSALRGFAQYFAKKFAGKQPDEEFANTMVREADRLNRVITDLLYLARNKSVNYGEVYISEIAGEVESLLRFDLEEKNTLLEHDFALSYLWADEDSLKQAVLNLMLNSLDSIGERREKEDSEWQGHIRLRSFRKENWAVFEIIDNGVGMNAEQKTKAFEAFFTSKAKGTGLGLALVHKTLHEHGGHTLIDSQPMRGCTVSLYFPYKEPDDKTARTGGLADGFLNEVDYE